MLEPGNDMADNKPDDKYIITIGTYTFWVVYLPNVDKFVIHEAEGGVRTLNTFEGKLVKHCKFPVIGRD